MFLAIGPLQVILLLFVLIIPTFIIGFMIGYYRAKAKYHNK